jgi:uncharacterized protein YkwD
LRTSLLLLAVVVFVVAPAAALGVASPSVAPEDNLERAVLEELNLVRLEHGLRSLRANPRLTAAAEHHTQDMVTSGFFSHTSPDGRPAAARIKRFYKPRTARRPWTVAENLIWHEQRLSARAAIAAWLASPGHRENLLKPAFREVGISAVRAHGAPGVFGNRSVVVVTVDFGRR